ncbi:RNA polymerase sigma factor [Pyxidicoccus xibeiensis]|uniref:RNA polymerase sigma factor n=1 Tax=Pyxidicoccus xibeiensis TaxID=2906759 RepID=UPI0020A7CAF3|nr:sigma-70 family RNA polymerase sigma factor [Pyxidicoccus xibeiensis]MCP3144504.1 sigma-70 family RNA polymerase sigma factor [Pyxidicoccus xibeiensis]
MAPPEKPQKFATTRWSLIAAAGGGASAPDALATLCELYWHPCYAFIRRRGYAADPAYDLTQGFFVRLLEKNDLATVDRERGRFRSWLLAALKHHLANDWHREQTQKRGGGAVHLSIDGAEAESEYGRFEPSHDVTPEKLFERRWALALLERALETLRAEYARLGKADLFEQLGGSLTGDRDVASYQAIATELGMTESNVKVSAHRLRNRYRALIQEEIARTVEREDDVDDELRHLLAALE